MSSKKEKLAKLEAKKKAEQKEILNSVRSPPFLIVHRNDVEYYDVYEYYSMKELKDELETIKDDTMKGELIMICEVKHAIVTLDDGIDDDYDEDDEDDEIDLDSGETLTDYSCPVCERRLIWDMNEGCYLCKNCDQTFTYDKLTIMEQEKEIERKIASAKKVVTGSK